MDLLVAAPRPPAADPPPAAGPPRGRILTGANGVRAVAHLLAWAPFVIAVARLVSRGWRPVADGAAIAIRSWDVLTAHGPLVGQATRLASGVFDPGPLQYWLQTLPLHLDPAHGLLWGAALWCMAAASLAIEGAWSAAGPGAALAASATVLATVAWMPGVALQPFWNPWFGVMFLYASVALAWAVLAGRRGWWPVLVAVASVAAQAHLMFTVLAAALVVVALAAGLPGMIREHAGYRWLAAGLAVGAACWSAPLIQQFTGRRGNLTALLHAQAATGRQEGLGFGLKAIAAAAGPPAIWWKPLESLLNPDLIGARSALAGAVIVLITAAALVVAWRSLRSRWLTALGVVSLLASAGAVASFASIAVRAIPPHPSPLDTVNYLMIPLLLTGALCWFTIGSAVVLAVRRAVGRRSGAAATGQHAAGDRERPAAAGRAAGTTIALGATAIAVAALLAAGASAAVVHDGHEFPGVADRQVVRAVGIAAARIERQVPRQPLVLSVYAPGIAYRKRRLLLGLAFVLRTRGYAPEVTAFGPELGPRYVVRGRPIGRARVVLRGRAVSVVITGARGGGGHPG